MLRRCARLARQAVGRFREAGGDRLAAALAYHSIFSLAPLFMLGAVLSTMLLGREAVRQHLLDFAGGLLGGEAAAAIEPWLLAAHRPRAGAVTTLVGLGTLLFGASRLFLVLQDALDAVYRVPARRRGLRGYLRRRALAFCLVLAALAVVVAAPLLGAALSWLGRYERAATAALLAGEALLFALVFRLVPAMRLRWRYVVGGGAVAAALMAAAQAVFGLYLQRVAWRSVYGASASLVALLVWVYVCAQILLLGAAFVQAFAGRCEGDPMKGSDPVAR